MKCRRGCGECCILETVCELEAFVITRSLEDGRINHHKKLPTETQKENETRPCPFLESDVCTIYPVRPVICRTHGLPLLHRSENRIECCPRNFAGTDISDSFSNLLLDAEAIAEALMRLNAAFLISRGENPHTGKRVDLSLLKESMR
jgi:hypothetical protein